jgi:hypothetical protein
MVVGLWSCAPHRPKLGFIGPQRIGSSLSPYGPRHAIVTNLEKVAGISVPFVGCKILVSRV